MEKDSGKCAMKRQTTETEQSSSSPALYHVQGESPPLSPRLAATFKVEFSPAVEGSVVEKAPCVSFTTDDTDTNKQETVTQVNELRKWRKPTLAVTIASLIASLSLCAASFFASATMDSSAVLASALDTLLAVFSASVVIWRFSDDMEGKVGLAREKCGSIAFGVVFIINGAITIAVSAFHLIDKNKPKHSDITWPALLAFSFIYCVLAFLECCIARRNKSSVLISLCIDDAMTSGILFGLFISSLILDQISHLWYLDHLVAITLALIILASGLKIFVDICVYKELPFQVFNSEL